MSALRKILRGYGANIWAAQRRLKSELREKLKTLDNQVDIAGLTKETWEERNKVELELATLYKAEEIYWQQRGGEKWILEGDANTRFFHGVANGRRRKCQIEMLQTEEGRLQIRKIWWNTFMISIGNCLALK